MPSDRNSACVIAGDHSAVCSMHPPVQQSCLEGGKPDCGAVAQPASSAGPAAPCIDQTLDNKSQDNWDAKRQPCIVAVNAVSCAVEEGQRQISAIRSLRHSVEKDSLRRELLMLFPV